MSIHEEMKVQAALKRRLDILDHQTKAISALSLALDSSYAGDDWADTAISLRHRLAKEVVLNCQQIWELSGPRQDKENGSAIAADSEGSAPDPF